MILLFDFRQYVVKIGGQCDVVIVFFIHIPFRHIIFNVFGNTVHFICIADDAVVE